MTLADCVGWPLALAETKLKSAGLKYEMSYTRSPRRTLNDDQRTARVIAVQGDTLLIGFFADGLSMEGNSARAE